MATSEQDTRTLINNKIKLNKQKNITGPVMNGVLNLIVTFIVDLYNGLLAKINSIPVETSDTIKQKLGVDVLSGSNTGDQDLSQLQNITEKNAANGYAGLDNAGKVPASLLPSYVDDVLEFATLSAFPVNGESGKIYTDLSNNKIYRWSGSAYVNIAASPGSTDSVTEGATNLYFTNNRVLTTLLSGLSVINSIAISATDNILAAFGKLQAQISTLNNNKVDKNGTDSLMSAAEHSKLNSIADNANNYVHPATHSASIIDQDETHRFLTDSQIATFAAKQNNIGYTPENIANKNAANGYAGLDSTGKVPSTLLPSYVDDVLEFATKSAFPATGESGKIYTDLATDKIYRWSGSTYVNIAASPGSTDSVTEGATNLYFTSNRVLNALLTGLSFASNLAITATDSIIVAFGKLQAQITAIKTTAEGAMFTAENIQVGGRNLILNTGIPVTRTIPCFMTWPLSDKMVTGSFTLKFKYTCAVENPIGISLGSATDSDGAYEIIPVLPAGIDVYYTTQIDFTRGGQTHFLIWTNQTITISELKIEIGNIATDYTEAPEDLNTDLTAKITNIKIGGVNLLRNSRTNVSYPAVTESIARASFFITKDLIAGQQYTFQIRAKTNTANDLLFITLTSHEDSDGVGWWFRQPINTYHSSTDYIIYTLTVTISANLAAGKFLLLYQEASCQSCSIDYVMLEEGNKPSTYSVAPEDIEELINAALPKAGGSMSNTNLVTNLNAELLNGFKDTDFFKKYATYAKGNVSGTPTFDFTNRGIITATATANITNFTVTGIPVGDTCLLILTVNAGITVAMPTGWKKIATATVESGKTNTFSFLNVDGTIKQVNVAAYE